MLVDGGRDGLQLQWQPTLPQQSHSSQAALVAAFDPGQRFIGFLGAAIQGDFNREGRPLQKVVGDSFCDQSSIGEQSDQETLLLRVGVNLKEICACENLPACVEKPQATQVRQIIQQPKVLVLAQFPAASLLVGHRQVVV